MTRDEFLSLPAGVALGVLYDACAGVIPIESVPLPKIPRSPKFDFAIYRKEGVQWASETDADGLQWWMNRYADNAANGGEWAAKDEKKAKQVGYWLEWRRADPGAVWSGERNSVQVRAAGPSHKPMVYEKQVTAPRPATAALPKLDDEEDSDVPF